MSRIVIIVEQNPNCSKIPRYMLNPSAFMNVQVQKSLRAHAHQQFTSMRMNEDKPLVHLPDSPPAQ